MWCRGHEGLWDSPIAGRQTGWHPKCSFFILETAVVSVTTLVANEVWVRAGGGGVERRLMGLNTINCCRIGGGSWPWTVNTIPSHAAHWSAASPSANIHLDTSSYEDTVYILSILILSTGGPGSSCQLLQLKWHSLLYLSLT